jgi:hypothetical protein
VTLKRAELLNAFPDAIELSAGLFRCKDEVPAYTQHYYVRMAPGPGDELLLVTRQHTDDEFVADILAGLGPIKHAARLHIEPIPTNAYGFSALLLVPSSYHRYFIGRLDRERSRLTLVVPMHRCEFTGTESAEEFATVTREVVAIHDWHRRVAPRIVLHFDNPLTGAGTDHDVFCTRELLIAELQALNGSKGFVEITNFEGRVVEVLSEQPDVYLLIRDRNDDQAQQLVFDRLLPLVDEFLVQARSQ